MNSETQPSVVVETRDAVAWVTLNRPAAINAIDDSIRSGLPAALAALAGDAGVAVVVLQGAGERGFCAGADLKEKRDPPAAPRAARATPDWIGAFDRLAKPVVAAIHGYCLGGGLEIALACDLRVASADAVFALPETGLGLIPGGGGTQRLPRLVGLGRALELVLTGDRIDAARALEWGLNNRLAPTREALVAETEALARHIASRPPRAIRHAKRAARAGIELGLDAGLRLERELFAELLAGDERREAASAFQQKRAGAADPAAQ